MGDMADFIQGQFFDTEDFDPMFNMRNSGRHGYPHRKRTSYICKYCMLDGLVWKQTEVGFRLFDKMTDEVHKCTEYKTQGGSENED